MKKTLILCATALLIGCGSNKSLSNDEYFKYISEMEEPKKIVDENLEDATETGDVNRVRESVCNTYLFYKDRLEQSEPYKHLEEARKNIKESKKILKELYSTKAFNSEVYDVRRDCNTDGPYVGPPEEMIDLEDLTSENIPGGFLGNINEAYQAYLKTVEKANSSTDVITQKIVVDDYFASEYSESVCSTLTSLKRLAFLREIDPNKLDAIFEANYIHLDIDSEIDRIKQLYDGLESVDINPSCSRDEPLAYYP